MVVVVVVMMMLLLLLLLLLLLGMGLCTMNRSGKKGRQAHLQRNDGCGTVRSDKT